MDNQVKPNYRCSQEELYTIADFSKTKAKYTSAYIATQQKEIDNARNLGTAQARTSGTEMVYTPLKPLAEVCLDQYNFLSIYIDDAFPAENEKAAHEAAGSAYYAKAANGNWMNLRNLNSAAMLFIQNNLDTLSAGGTNMPDGFPQQYSDAVAKFDEQYMSFVKSSQKDPAGTTGKINANNGIYNNLTAMFKDGAAIYRRNDTVKSYFTFDDILHHITGERTTGIRFETIEAVTELPVAGVSITAQPGNTSSQTDDTGITKIDLPQNTYTLTIIPPPGYAPIPAQSVKTTTGIMHRKKFILTKLS